MTIEDWTSKSCVTVFTDEAEKILGKCQFFEKGQKRRGNFKSFLQIILIELLYLNIHSD